MNRRGLILGLISAPAVIRTPGLLMPVKPVIILPTDNVQSFIVRVASVFEDDLLRDITKFLKIDESFLAQYEKFLNETHA